MLNFFSNITKSAYRYDQLSDSKVEEIGLKYGIPGGLAGGIFDRQYVIGQLLKRDELNGSKIAVLISFLALIVSLVIFPLSFYLNLRQIDDLSITQDTRYFNYALSFSDRLEQMPSSGISNAIEANQLILKENGGKFSTHDLDIYLGLYNQLSDIRDYGLITDDLIENNFSDDLIAASKNPEVTQYLQNIRKINPDYFRGFDTLVILAKTQNQNI